MSSKWKRSSLPAPLTEIAAIAKEEMVRSGIGDRCIAGARICIDLLKKYGFSVKPASVKVFAWNEIYQQKFKALGRVMKRTEIPTGGYSIGLGAGIPNNYEWCGHLVAIIGGRTLVDLTLDHISRPDHDIYLPPYFIRDVSRKFLNGEKPLVIRDPHGPTYFTYGAYPLDLSYDSAPLWNTKRVTAPVVEAIADRLSLKMKTEISQM